jgi:hypothetical protein
VTEDVETKLIVALDTEAIRLRASAVKLDRMRKQIEDEIG